MCVHMNGWLWRWTKGCYVVSASNLSFGVGNGTVIAVPTPSEAWGLGNEVEEAIVKALAEAG